MKRNGISVRRFLRGLAALLLLAVVVAWWAWPEPQTIPGRKVDYYATHGSGWEVACDTGAGAEDRGCYIQYVDVYRPRPDFAAAMVELVMHAGADGQANPHIRFDIEPELSFREASIAIETATGPVPLDVSGCATNTCRLSGDRARAVLALWRTGRAITLEIQEDRGTPARLRWPLDRMDLILDDFATRRAERGLP